MPWASIKKSSGRWAVQPNMLDYEHTCASFSWEAVRRELDGLPGGQGLNIAHEAVDRYANGAHRDRVAIRWLGRDGTRRDLTYGAVQEQSNRFANVLRNFDVGKGERVFSLAGRIPELYFAALGTWKNTSVFCPLFAAFGPEPVYQRLSRGDAKLLVTTERFYQQKIAGIRQRLPQLQHVLLADADADPAPMSGPCHG
jgi:acetyl-CoA synthetase